MRDAPTDRVTYGVAEKRLSGTADLPAYLVLDRPNPLLLCKEENLGPQEYVTLDFADAGLIKRVHLPDGTELQRAQLG